MSDMPLPRVFATKSSSLSVSQYQNVDQDQKKQRHSQHSRRPYGEGTRKRNEYGHQDDKAESRSPS